MAIKLSVISTKGGTGKTTLAVNLGAILADLNQRVLLVDADPQPTRQVTFHCATKLPMGCRNSSRAGVQDLGSGLPA